MDRLHISALHPELTALGSKHIKATVALMWPYSSSARRFALLLVEPDFRLRLKKGRIRARFSESSAKALASTGVGIADEIVLSLQGARFVQKEVVGVPGNDADWDLLYTETIIVQVFRNDNALADLEMVNVMPTPTSCSLFRREAVADPSPANQWSAPAFLKRVRLAEGPVFSDLYDVSVEGGDSLARNCRRKRYRDRKAWVYSARVPSPDECNYTEDEVDMNKLSSSTTSRAMSTYNTPRPPPAVVPLSAATGLFDSVKGKEGREPATAKEPALSDIGRTAKGETATNTKSSLHEAVHDTGRNGKATGSGKVTWHDLQYAFGGDTEVDTERNTNKGEKEEKEEEEEEEEDEEEEEGVVASET
ncbi:hypothetical protein N0V95_009511 [Ascochyta clinopodiicola]|nr:hypothetical protein N0V95_009511 [Ascochyta clinopodiicola]